MGINTSFINKAIITILVVVLLFSIYSAIIPEAQTGGDEMGDAYLCTELGACILNATANETYPCRLTANQSLNCTGGQVTSIPLSGLFSGTGMMFVIIMAGMLFLVIKGILAKGKK